MAPHTEGRPRRRGGGRSEAAGESAPIARRAPHKSWILTGSLENFRINVERGFDVIGFKERRRLQAREFEPGDEIVFYVTGVQAFGGIARVRSEMFEDRDADLAPGQEGKKPEPYPWRVEAEPVLVLHEEEFVPAEELVDELEHVPKWPAEHWHLAFQGQLRTIGEADAELLRERLSAAASRRRAPRVSDEGAGCVHERHFTREEANALLPQLKPLLRQLRDAKDELTDDEAHEVLSDAGADQRRRRAGPQVGVAFLEVRRLLETLEEVRNRPARHRPGAGRLPRPDRGPRGLPLLGARRGRGRLLARPLLGLPWPPAARLSPLRFARARCATFAACAATSAWP